MPASICSHFIRVVLTALMLLLYVCLVIKLAMKACPYRATFYPKLGSPPEKVDADLDAWLAALSSIVTRMQTFYTSGAYDKGL